MTRIAIIGGGPGGLMTAYLVERKYGDLCRVTLFEATDRIGGKILTLRFDSDPVTYEAGVAEVYDYKALGADPLRRLVIEFNAPVSRVRKNRVESYRVHYRRGSGVMSQDFDVVIIALPHKWLSSIEWGGERLRLAMAAHIAYHDRPAHDPRVSILFDKPFWSRFIPDRAEHPGIFIVGDHLFGSTLNAVFDSANVATDLIRSRMPTQPLRFIAAT
ncbi:MAG: FAD-dependent oxidoreductase [Blastocatellia bacterium]